MKLISWNVNGLRACMTKGFNDFLAAEDPDVICLQETKMQREQADFDFAEYTEFWNSAEKKGYAGTATFTKTEPLNVTYGIGDEQFDCEGRVICAEFPEFYLVTVYTPNAQRELVRIDFRMAFEDKFRAYLERLHETKPVIVCGDMNVAHRRIDIKNAKPNIGSAGFRTKKEGSFPNCSRRVLWIRSANCIPMQRTRIPGGRIWARQEKRTSAGALTISSSRRS